MHLPIDYPRINQFPEWFIAEDQKEYRLVGNKYKSKEYLTGTELKNGIELNLTAGIDYHFVVEEVSKY